MLLNIDMTGDMAGLVRILRDEQRRWRKEEQNQKILAWLSSLDFAARHRDLAARRVPGTATEIFRTTEFLEWNDGATTATPGLWCQGRMGSGKSVTSAAVVEHLEASSFHRTSVVVDGLDELAYQQEGVASSPRMSVLERALDKLLTRGASRADIRVLLKSRFGPHSETETTWAKLAIAAAEHDVRSYVKCALEEDSWMSPWVSRGLATKVQGHQELVREIAEILATQADGMLVISPRNPSDPVP